MALSCLAGTNPVLPVNSRTSCPGKLILPIWKINSSPARLFNNYRSISLFFFFWEKSFVHYGRKKFVLFLSRQWRVPNLITWHIFTRALSCFLHSSVPFFFWFPWNLFRSISIGVLFVFSPHPSDGPIFFFPRPNDALKFIFSLDESGRS